MIYRSKNLTHLAIRMQAKTMWVRACQKWWIRSLVLMGTKQPWYRAIRIDQSMHRGMMAHTPQTVLNRRVNFKAYMIALQPLILATNRYLWRDLALLESLKQSICVNRLPLLSQPIQISPIFPSSTLWTTKKSRCSRHSRLLSLTQKSKTRLENE